MFSPNDNTIKQTDIVMLLTPRIIRTHDLRAQDLSPIYIGTQSNMSLTGPPATIGGGAPELDPAAAAQPPAAGAPVLPPASTTAPGTPTAPSAAPIAPAPTTTQPITQPPVAPV